MKLTTKIAFGLVTVWFALSSSILYPSGPPEGSAGAPNESTCQQSGCHGGGTFGGNVALSGLPDTVAANTNYTITLTTNTTAPRAGFQLVCLDVNNAQCGSLTAGTGTAIGLLGNKQYISQSSPKILSGGNTSWTFTWKSPVSLANNLITFYFVSLAANGNGGTSGDNVLRSSKIVRLRTTTSSNDLQNRIAVKIFPNPTKDVLNIELAEAQNAQLTLTDINGRILLYKNLTDKSSKINIEHLSKGYYNVQIQAGKQSASKKIVVN